MIKGTNNFLQENKVQVGTLGANRLTWKIPTACTRCSNKEVIQDSSQFVIESFRYQKYTHTEFEPELAAYLYLCNKVVQVHTY